MLRFYPKPAPDGGIEGYSLTDIRTGQMWFYADVTCVHCGKEQLALAGGSLGGPCVRCHKPTLGQEQHP